MAKNTLKPDTILKNYWSDNAHFADFFNAVLFDGRLIIKPEDLQEMDTETPTIIEHRKYTEMLQAARDKIKIFRTAVAYGVRFALLGLENQEHIHYAMPMKTMGYDYSAYKKQYDSNAKKYKDAGGLNSDEFLSKMHLVEARENNLTFHNANNEDLFNLLQIILDQTLSRNEAKQKAIEYSETHHTDDSVIMTVAGATNSKLDYNKLKGSGTMCTLFDEIASESRLEGELKSKLEGKAEEIIETGREYSHTDDMILERLQRKLNISLEDAQKYLAMYGQ